MFTRKIAMFAIAGAFSAAALAGCSSNNSAAQNENQQQQADSLNTVKTQPLPSYQYSQLRQNLIEIENAEAAGVQSTSFLFINGQQDPYLVCASIGMPIPGTDSLSNPQQLVSGKNTDGGTVGQMDPDGVYSGDTSATHVLCVEPGGKSTVVYAEGPVTAIFAPAKWDTATHQIVLDGDPTYKFSTSEANK